MNLALRCLVHIRGEGRLRPWAASRLAAFCLLLLPLLLWADPQARPEAPTSDKAAPAAVQHVKLLLDKGSPAIEIETTAPVNPQIGKSADGMHLDIDFPNTDMSVPDKVVPIKNPDLSGLRLSLRNTVPPMVHVEVDFLRPLGYTWDTSGNRLLLRFHEVKEDDLGGNDLSKNDPGKNDAAASSTAAAGANPLPVSLPIPAPDFAHVVTAEQLTPSASLAAGSETTVLRIRRLGDVYVCPQTSILIVHSKNGPDLTLAMNDGGLETHLALQNSADEVVTPDFRILLRGPGEFHYAIRADSRGNTCVRTLPGNTASAIIYELLGDGTYNVQAQDQIVFRDGKLSPANAAAQSGSVLPLECGCPPPARATLLASIKPDPRLAVELPSADPPSAPAVSRPDPVSGAEKDKNAVSSGTPARPETAMEIRDLPEAVRQQPHLAVEASLSFTPNPARLAARNLPASSRQLSSPVRVQPPGAPPAGHKSVLGKLKSFLSRVFE